jgi:hypothetical protein
MHQLRGDRPDRRGLPGTRPGRQQYVRRLRVEVDCDRSAAVGQAEQWRRRLRSLDQLAYGRVGKQHPVGWLTLGSDLHIGMPASQHPGRRRVTEGEPLAQTCSISERSIGLPANVFGNSTTTPSAAAMKVRGTFR